MSSESESSVVKRGTLRTMVLVLSPCAHHVPHYTAQTLRARGKRAVVLPRAFGLQAIIARWTWCATSTASATTASTATTPMHSPMTCSNHEVVNANEKRDVSVFGSRTLCADQSIISSQNNAHLKKMMSGCHLWHHSSPQLVRKLRGCASMRQDSLTLT
jgi:hypothetical protein